MPNEPTSTVDPSLPPPAVPLSEVGLSPDEYTHLCSLLGRIPNAVELGMVGAMWSEHCGYKNSRPLLKLFPTRGPRVLQGPGENAGAVDIGAGLAVVFKIESHNHPSAVEPVEGAATGVGGIVRDIFTMGARPIALLNSLRFGPLAEPRTRYLFGGVVAGIGRYGNAIGVPTVGGEIYFHPSYAGNPLVNAMCVGIIAKDALMSAKAEGVGNPVLLVGADTGRDGIHGATFASDTLDAENEAKRPAVQVGNPFLEKCLIEACLEVLATGIVVGMQDLGAAGLTSSTVEAASRGGAGVRIDVARVPRRERGMNAYEVMLSESQERMLVVVRRGAEARAQAIFARWGLHCAEIGEVTTGGRVAIFDGAQQVVDLPATLLTDECPVYHRQGRPAPQLAALQAPDWAAILPPEPAGADYSAALLSLLAAPNIASKAAVYRTYDHTIGTNTVLAPGQADAAVLRIKGTAKGIAVTTDCNSRFCYLDPYEGGMQTVAEAARNLVCTGATPLAVTDCLNFGSPERPEVFYQMEGCVRGIVAACEALGTPVVSGNVSLYNETAGQAVLPTPVVGMVGLLEDVTQRVGMAWPAGATLCVLAPVATVGGVAALGASEYLATVHGQEAGRPPAIDLAAEQRVQAAALAAIGAGLVLAAHDCSEGGLAVALAEGCITGGVGAHLDLAALDESPAGRGDVLLFNEAPSRIVLACAPASAAALGTLAARHDIRLLPLGPTGGDTITLQRGPVLLAHVPLAAAADAWHHGLERA
ncbi:MAG TPA: phosphoribosylformylglycinamidine synthase subunit PurL [Chloroflexia bacterium]|nr:phosphoribosylformylglycinamidine synthase subunit PurL [Chloroflexia bacterium]